MTALERWYIVIAVTIGIILAERRLIEAWAERKYHRAIRERR